MAKPKLTTISSLLLLVLLLHSHHTTANTEAPATYIIHVSPSPSSPSSSHLLRSVPGPTPRLIYNYTLAAHGFSAILTPSQVLHLRRHQHILSVRRDGVRYPHTTHTSSFLRLSNSSSGLWSRSDYASDTIIGVLDTGVYPYSRSSFDDAGLPPVPSSWRGSCDPSFPCNRKLVGAKFFSHGYSAAAELGLAIDASSFSPLDTEGHGTHTASTAAGSEVPDSGFYTYARGTARGMATKARIAAYKICWASGCYDSDILAAMDAAIADGVHVISLSVGANGYSPAFYRDSIAIGAFGAVRHGVVVSCSAGNSGPGAYTAVNIAPWILTVGASTVDREFPADVVLGDGSVLPGVSLYAGEPLDSTVLLPLVSGADAGSRLCISGYLDPSKVEGKIVVCDRGGNARVEKGSVVKSAGGVGMIMANTAESGEELLADSHLVPATMVGEEVGNKIRNYIKTDPSPTASLIFRGTVIGSSDPAAPKVASFSSRGPNYRAPEIVKPDVIAPGVNILAAWTGESSPTDLDIDQRRVEFNIISGTSMSCPHVSGLAALLRKAHPDWSPAAVKSALMTTAYNLDNSGETIKDLATGGESTPFVRGSGHVDPELALDPGLVYDLQPDDYVAFLCSVGYYPEQIAVVTRDGVGVNCSDMAKKLKGGAGGLNYPSFGVVFESDTDSVTYGREVKNVGGGAAVYEVEVSSPADVNVTVSPNALVFGSEGESLSYEITFASVGAPAAKRQFGWISWSDGVHKVRSPIAVSWRQGGLVSSI